MAPGQDWCLQCGAGMRAAAGEPGWRSGAAILVIAGVLLLGAAAAGYAALSKGSRKAPVVTQTVAQAPPAAVAPATALPGATATPGALPKLKVAKPPKIPLTASTTKVTIPTTVAPTTTTTPTTKSNTGSGETETNTTGGASGEGSTKAILLDTNAASTYNPYGYPESNFGDPSLAIDENESTGWTAKVEAATAPRLAEGLLIDVKSARRIASLKLLTTTPGMTVQVYGSAAATVPASITDKAWVPLSRSTKDKQKSLRIGLRESTKAFRWITLWVSRAPASSTPEKPGRVTVNELELFAAG